MGHREFGLKCELLVNVIDGVSEDELDVLPQCQPRQCFGLPGDQVEVLRRAELDAHAFGIGLLLDGGVCPLLAILEEALAGNELPLLRLLHNPFLAFVGRRFCGRAARYSSEPECPARFESAVGRGGRRRIR